MVAARAATAIMNLTVIEEYVVHTSVNCIPGVRREKGVDGIRSERAGERENEDTHEDV